MTPEITIKEYGLGGVFNGIQIDVVVVKKQTSEGCTESPLCDHNCVKEVDGRPTGGKYNCPAAFTLNKGTRPDTLASKEEIIHGIKNVAEGIERSKKYFLGKFFDEYSSEFDLPPHFAEALRTNLGAGGVEINLFGGNPEMHPDIAAIVAELKQLGYIINLTTTGRRLMHDQKFVEDISANPPHLLALSADEFDSPETIKKYAQMSLEEIKKEWQTVPPFFGQRQKMLEAIYATKLLHGRVKILYNIAVHPGNIVNIYQLIDALKNNLPGVLINPYPAQSSFLYEPAVFAEEQMSELEKFVQYMIGEQVGQMGQTIKIFVPRLHYWLMLKSIFNTYQDKKRMATALSGYGVWQCFRRPGSGRYIQIGLSTLPNDKPTAGGYFGCFWNNQTVTDSSEQVWNMNNEQIDDYLIAGPTKLAARCTRPCPGCIMPRLNFDLLGVEKGMNLELKNNYLKLRKEYIGF